MEMEEESVQAIRNTNRNELFLNRRRHKDEQTDVQRSLPNLQLTQCDVTAIANKLKTKSSISTAELKFLQNSLIDNPKNFEIVLNTHGTLRGLVRELTGHDISKQCAACGCLCNLALGDLKACCIIAKAAAAYLVAALDTLTTQLAMSCAWALGNLAGAGSKACELLVPQGAISKLCDVMESPTEVQEAAVYALTHVAFAMMDELRPEHLHKMIQSLSTVDLNTETCHLLFILSCHKDFVPDLIPEAYLYRIIEKLTVSMAHHLNICNGACGTNGSDQNHTKGIFMKCCELVYLVRVLGNMNNENMYIELANYFVSNNLVGTIRSLLQMEMDKSLLWLLGNMLNCGCGVFFDQLAI